MVIHSQQEFLEGHVARWGGAQILRSPARVPVGSRAWWRQLAEGFDPASYGAPFHFQESHMGVKDYMQKIQ